eukprot:704551-Prymnesium_polylepis.1
MLPGWETSSSGASSCLTQVDDVTTHQSKKSKKKSAAELAAAVKAKAEAEAAKLAAEKSLAAKKEGDKKAGAGILTLSKAARVEKNFSCVFYYDDGSFSKKGWWFDWKGICAKYGWDPDALCGCYVTSQKGPDKKILDCQDSGHPVNTTTSPRANSRGIVPSTREQHVDPSSREQHEDPSTREQH